MGRRIQTTTLPFFLVVDEEDDGTGDEEDSLCRFLLGETDLPFLFFVEEELFFLLPLFLEEKDDEVDEDDESLWLPFELLFAPNEDEGDEAEGSSKGFKTVS